MTDKAGPEDTPAKHVSMFKRRVAHGQCFHRPCLGTREFAAEFALVPEGAGLPECTVEVGRRDADFGLMLHDIDFARGKQSRFFRAEMRNGIIDVPPFHGTELMR